MLVTAAPRVVPTAASDPRFLAANPTASPRPAYLLIPPKISFCNLAKVALGFFHFE